MLPSLDSPVGIPAHCSDASHFSLLFPFSGLPPSPRSLQNELQRHISHLHRFLSLFFSGTIRPCLFPPRARLCKRNVSISNLHRLISDYHQCVLVEQFQFQILKYLKTILSPYFINTYGKYTTKRKYNI